MSIFTADDGCQVYFEATALTAGSIPLVLIPGLGGDGRFWAGLTAHLAPGTPLIMVDHRGAGRSDRPLGIYTIDRIAADTIGIMDQLGVGRAHIVGHSTGGAIGQTMALDHASRVESLVLSATWERPDDRFRTLFGARLALLEAGKLADYQTLAQILGYQPSYLLQHPELLERARTSATQLLDPPFVAVARVRMLLDHDRFDELSHIRARTLVIGAGDDMIVPIHHARALAQIIPGARLVETTGGHFFPVATPEKAAALIARHLLDAP